MLTEQQDGKLEIFFPFRVSKYCHAMKFNKYLPCLYSIQDLCLFQAGTYVVKLGARTGIRCVLVHSPRSGRFGKLLQKFHHDFQSRVHSCTFASLSLYRLDCRTPQDQEVVWQLQYTMLLYEVFSVYLKVVFH